MLTATITGIHSKLTTCGACGYTTGKQFMEPFGDFSHICSHCHDTQATLHDLDCLRHLLEEVVEPDTDEYDALTRAYMNLYDKLYSKLL